MARTLEERLAGSDPLPWIAEEAGDTVLGEVESIETRSGDYGDYPVVTIITADDEILSVAIWGTVLQKKFAEANPQEGDVLGFKYLGEQVPKSGGKPYKNWRLVIQRAARTLVTTPAATGDEFPEDTDTDED